MGCKQTLNMGYRISNLIGLILAFFGFAVVAQAQPFVGVNEPGAVTNFSFTTTATTTNYTLTLSGATNAYSYLFLRKGGVASPTNYTFAAKLVGTTNIIALENPEAAAGTWNVSVVTPPDSEAHSFTLELKKNVAGLRSSQPVDKPLAFSVSGIALGGKWQYYRVEVPEQPVRLALTLSGTNQWPDLYFQKDTIPTTTSFLRASTGVLRDTLNFTDLELVPGNYFIGVHTPTGKMAYQLNSGVIKIIPLVFDPGEERDGTDTYKHPVKTAGDTYFRVRTELPDVGAWRTALKVISGDANLYVSRGQLPSARVADYRSTRVGSDGIILSSGQFAAGQDWYILVQASTNTQWTLVSGAPFVTDLGTLSETGSSGTSAAIGPDGWLFYKTVIAQGALAWRLSLNGATNEIFVKKTSVPLSTSGKYEARSLKQMLAVPPYLVAGEQYFVGVPGVPGKTISLDSRVQAIQNINFTSASTNLSGNGYTTYRVAVPPQMVAWQIDLSSSSTATKLYVRQSLVPNEWINQAFSEVVGTNKSLSLVPPLLTDGTFYITVAGTGAHSFTLKSGQSQVTDIDLTSETDNADAGRVGWRYFRLTDIDRQLGALGWELFLRNSAPGTRIALRRSQAPGMWDYRPYYSAVTLPSRYYDYISQAASLKRPGHQADVWYIGVYNPGTALKQFTLVSREIAAKTLPGDNGTLSQNGLPKGEWAYFRVDVPSDVLGWDVRLGSVVGLPKMVIGRQALPGPDIVQGVVLTNISTTLSLPATATNWLIGKQWLTKLDWTLRAMNSLGVDESGRIMAMGMGRPMQPGTYYAGVYNAGATSLNFTIRSRFIGSGRTIPVANVAFQNGTATNAVSPREVNYYRVTVPPNSRSWKVKLTVESGEAMMVVSTNKIPNIESAKRVQKPTPALSRGREHFVLLPDRGKDYIKGGDHYIAVIGEGAGTKTGRIGTGSSRYTIESVGEMVETNLGIIPSAGITRADKLEAGEVKAYHFTVPANIAGYEIFVTNKVGNPVAVIGTDTRLPDPGLGKTIPAEPYGHEGGQDSIPDHEVFDNHLYAAALPGVVFSDTLMLMARSRAGVFSDASYTLKIKELVPQAIPFNQGVQNVAGHPPGTWKFFRVVVPGNALGWDVRLVSVLAGSPKLIVCRGILPIPFKHDGFHSMNTDFWSPGIKWAPGVDWTGRSYSPLNISEDGRLLAMGMGHPLEADTYYVGVYASNLCTYTIKSRGIGDGYSIPVTTLAFDHETVVADNLPAREAAYFRVNVPANAKSWKVSLDLKSKGEANLIVLKDAVPNVLAAATAKVIHNSSAGRKNRKTGPEDFVLLPPDKQPFLSPGVYYLAVISEGGNPLSTLKVGADKVGYTLTSHGELPLLDLGTLASPITNQASMQGGEVVGYQFQIPPGTVSLEARLENKVGNPVMVLRQGPFMPDPSSAYPLLGADIYGTDGGEILGTRASDNVITYANPTNGIYYLLVKARPIVGVYTNASFRLRLSVITSAPLPFDGGSVTVANQTSGSWSYFRVDVPEGALGWDLRLTNVLSGLPRIVVCKDALPGSATTKPWGLPGSQLLWPTTNQWAAATDWTRRQFSPEGTVDENGRILAMGMGKPLMPGSYYVGVVNTVAASASMSYTIMSRGIGDGYIIPVTALPFAGGSVTNLVLPSREAAYYKVEIPTNAPSFKLKLTGLFGEAMMVGLRGFIPNVDYNDSTRSIQLGKTIQKSGNEHYLLLPPANQTYIGTGSVFFAVAGEGAVTNATRIGKGTSGYVLNTLGALPLTDLGVLAGTNESVYADSLEGGESKGYEFVLAPEVLGVEAKLENRVGNPVMVWREGELLPNPGGTFVPSPEEFYGNEGGSPVTAGSQTLLTLATTTAQSSEGFTTNRLMIKARAISSVFSDASYTLRLRPIIVPELNFTASMNQNGRSNSVTATLENGHRSFYKVVVPDGQLGWKLELAQASGIASVRVRKDQFPSDTPLTGSPFVSPAAYIVTPLLTAGTWFVEVKAQSFTTYTLTSSALGLERTAWNMPAIGETNTAPGMSLPYFGDSAINTNGVPLASESAFLESGYQHYYAFYVPTQNVGLVRMQLEAVSGNPNIYLRYAGAPTISHSLAGVSGTIYDRTLAGSLGTEYANFVPMDGKVESSMKSGLWYVAVRAVGANSRYRIRLSTGNIQQIPIDGSLLSDQVVAGGDWKYYRFRMPDPVPTKWQLTFSKQLGDMGISIRDTVPPGNGTIDRRHWGTDVKNQGPYPELSTAGTYTFETPPSRPGEIYYVGVRGINDATFSISVKTLETGAIMPTLLSFYSGTMEGELPPFSQRMYRIDVPAEATRLKFTNIHSSAIRFFMEQGTLPLKKGQDDWFSLTANSSMTTSLGTWPWMPAKSYFLFVTNSAATTQTFTIQSDGKNALTDDFDKDGLLDAWERQYFATTAHNGTGDFDLDGVNNMNEFMEGTNPADNISFNPRLIVSAANGTVIRNPNNAYFSKNTTVQLTPVPTDGYVFRAWSGSHFGAENPLQLLMDTNKSITAVFKVVGDDFETPVLLAGSSIVTNASNLGATKESLEVDHGGNAGGQSLWWSWTAPSSGVAEITTAGSTFPTLMGVYIGNALTNLFMETNDTTLTGGSYRAKVILNVESGVAYQIAVDGLNDATGTVQLAIDFSSFGRPDNVSAKPVKTSGSSEVAIRLLMPVPVGERTLLFKLPGNSNGIHIIEASTNLINWESVGVVQNGVAQPLQRKSINVGESMFYRLRAD